MGKESNHLRFSVRKYIEKKGAFSKGFTHNAVAFNFGYLAERLKDGDKLDILYSYEVNEFNGRSTLQLNIRDIRI